MIFDEVNVVESFSATDKLEEPYLVIIREVLERIGFSETHIPFQFRKNRYWNSLDPKEVTSWIDLKAESVSDGVYLFKMTGVFPKARLDQTSIEVQFTHDFISSTQDALSRAVKIRQDYLSEFYASLGYPGMVVTDMNNNIVRS